MKRIITTLALAATMVLATASVALAGGPNCAEIDTGPPEHFLVNHGDHITGDYVKPGADGPANGVRGRAAHFDLGFGPGASFCPTHGTNNAKPLGPRP